MTTFSDGDFQDSSWVGSIARDTTSAGASFTSGQQPAGGNPGAYRQTSHVWMGPGAIWVSHVFQPASHDPSTDGPLESVSYSWDFEWIHPPSALCGCGAIAFEPLVRQGGMDFIGPFDQVLFASDPSNTWLSFEFESLQASDFRFLDPALGPVEGVHPDFETTGAPLTFGYVTINGVSSGEAASTLGGVDNWSVTVTSIAPVPALSLAAVLVLTLGLAAGALRKLRLDRRVASG